MRACLCVRVRAYVFMQVRARVPVYALPNVRARTRRDPCADLHWRQLKRACRRAYTDLPLSNACTRIFRYLPSVRGLCSASALLGPVVRELLRGMS